MPDQKTEKPFDHVTVLIRRLTASESLRLLASSRCPVDLATSARRENDYRAARSPAGRSNRYYQCRVPKGARARTQLSVRESTKGRVEARSHAEKNDRTDLADKVVTR